MKRKSELGEKIYHGGGVTGQRIGQRWIKYEYEDNGDYGFIYALYHTEDERFSKLGYANNKTPFERAKDFTKKTKLSGEWRVYFLAKLPKFLAPSLEQALITKFRNSGLQVPKDLMGGSTEVFRMRPNELRQIVYAWGSRMEKKIPAHLTKASRERLAEASDIFSQMNTHLVSHRFHRFRHAFWESMYNTGRSSP